VARLTRHRSGVKSYLKELADGDVNSEIVELYRVRGKARDIGTKNATLSCEPSATNSISASKSVVEVLG
jgi:hypothetical protein